MALSLSNGCMKLTITADGSSGGTNPAAINTAFKTSLPYWGHDCLPECWRASVKLQMTVIVRKGHGWVWPIKIAQQVHKAYGVSGRKGCCWMCNYLKTFRYMQAHTESDARHTIPAYKKNKYIKVHCKRCVLGLEMCPYRVANLRWELIFPPTFS